MMIANPKGKVCSDKKSMPSYRRPTLASTTAHLDDDNFSHKIVNRAISKKRQFMVSSAPVRSRPLNVLDGCNTSKCNNEGQPNVESCSATVDSKTGLYKIKTGRNFKNGFASVNLKRALKNEDVIINKGGKIQQPYIGTAPFKNDERRLLNLKNCDIRIYPPTSCNQPKKVKSAYSIRHTTEVLLDVPNTHTRFNHHAPYSVASNSDNSFISDHSFFNSSADPNFPSNPASENKDKRITGSGYQYEPTQSNSNSAAKTKVNPKAVFEDNLSLSSTSVRYIAAKLKRDVYLAEEIVWRSKKNTLKKLGKISKKDMEKLRKSGWDEADTQNKIHDVDKDLMSSIERWHASAGSIISVLAKLSANLSDLDRLEKQYTDGKYAYEKELLKQREEHEGLLKRIQIAEKILNKAQERKVNDNVSSYMFDDTQTIENDKSNSENIQVLLKQNNVDNTMKLGKLQSQGQSDNQINAKETPSNHSLQMVNENNSQDTIAPSFHPSSSKHEEDNGNITAMIEEMLVNEEKYENKEDEIITYPANGEDTITDKKIRSLQDVLTKENINNGKHRFDMPPNPPSASLLNQSLEKSWNSRDSANETNDGYPMTARIKVKSVTGVLAGLNNIAISFNKINKSNGEEYFKTGALKVDRVDKVEWEANNEVDLTFMHNYRSLVVSILNIDASMNETQIGRAVLKGADIHDKENKSITLNIPAKKKDSSALNYVLDVNLEIIKVKHGSQKDRIEENSQMSSSFDLNNDVSQNNSPESKTEEGTLRRAMKWYVERGPEALDDPQSVLSVLNDGKI